MSFLCCYKKTPEINKIQQCFYIQQEGKQNRSLLSLFQAAIAHMEDFNKYDTKGLILLIDRKKGQIQGFNRRLFSVFGHSPKTLLGKPISDLLDKESPPLPAMFENELQTALQKNKSFAVHPIFILNLKNKSTVICEVYIESIDPPQRSIKYYYTTGLSATKAKDSSPEFSKDISMDSLGGYEEEEEEQPYFFLRLKPIKNN